ncbi:hypothetical protein CQY20_00155 [Mycolicibacterium agri]|nr:hypothetical protein CQY20_00155 [Mycolicibacterium agri]
MSLSGGYFLRLDSPFTLMLDGETTDLSPQTDPPERLVAIEQLIGRVITESVVDDSGVLTIAFDNGAVITCLPDDHYEAWMMTAPKGWTVAGTPGGEVGVWISEEP